MLRLSAELTQRLCTGRLLPYTAKKMLREYSVPFRLIFKPLMEEINFTKQTKSSLTRVFAMQENTSLPEIYAHFRRHLTFFQTEESQHPRLMTVRELPACVHLG